MEAIVEELDLSRSRATEQDVLDMIDDEPAFGPLADARGSEAER